MQNRSESPQQIWINGLTHHQIEDHTLSDYVNFGVSGVLSSPAFVLQRLSDHHRQISHLREYGKTPAEIADKILFNDAQIAADQLQLTHSVTNGELGFVGMAVNPKVARHADDLFSEGKRIPFDVDRDNVMVVLPAMANGIEAMQALIARGNSVTVSDVCSIATYHAVIAAYQAGVRAYADGLEEARHRWPMLFISVPISQISEHVAGLGIQVAHALYGHSTDLATIDNWQQLQQKGAHHPRFIWMTDGGDNVVKALMLPQTIQCVAASHVVALFGDEMTYAPAELQKIDLNDCDLQVIEKQIQQAEISRLHRAFEALEEAVI